MSENIGNPGSENPYVDKAATKELLPKEYIGDGIYIQDRGYGIVLTTENGVSIQNEIHIEPMKFKAIERYIKRIREDDRM